MTPEKYIGHRAFRIVESKKWPPLKASNGKRVECFASWLLCADGTELLYLRGPITDAGRALPDVIAVDATGKGCHRCVVEIGLGKLSADGEYIPHWYAAHKGKENPWGTLCDECRYSLAFSVREKYRKELARLKVLETELELLEQCEKESV